MTILNALNQIQAQNATLNTKFGTQGKLLTWDPNNPGQSELPLFARSFERAFLVPYSTTDRYALAAFYVRHIGEALFGASVIKQQTTTGFGGQVPDSNYVGMGPIRAAWLGVGNDWSDQPSLSAAALTNWIHSGTTLMAGTAGHAVQIGQYQVTVWCGYASNHPSPKVESLALTIDGKPKAGIDVGQACGRAIGSIGNSLNIAEFDNMILLNQKRTILAQLWSSVGGTDIPVALGFSFVPENIGRTYINPSGLPGTTNGVILTT